MSGLAEWLPPASREEFFGTDRGKCQLPNGKWLVADINVSDITGLNLWERLTSWPWRPFKKTAHTPRAYSIGDTTFCSYASYHKLKEHLLKEQS